MSDKGIILLSVNISKHHAVYLIYIKILYYIRDIQPLIFPLCIVLFLYYSFEIFSIHVNVHELVIWNKRKSY